MVLGGNKGLPAQRQHAVKFPPARPSLTAFNSLVAQAAGRKQNPGHAGK